MTEKSHPSFDLSGRVALITGPARGIWRARPSPALLAWYSNAYLMFNFEQWKCLSVCTMMPYDAARELRLWLALSGSPPAPMPMAREGSSHPAYSARQTKSASRDILHG